ncbi:hypothetical protein, partial [Salmonella enterica]|uniref:hypothetical protein n=1 Tax=Salmonella enterica TaxID=28901 RepID=UPI001CA5D1E8
MYLAWALPLLFPFLRQIGSEARIPGAEPHYFCIFTQSIEICRPCRPDNGNDHSQERDKLISL